MDKILLIVGSSLSDKCGIGDYSYKLVNSNKNLWEYYVCKKWNLTEIIRIIRNINMKSKRCINLQYPTKSSYGSIVPHLICLYYSLFTRKKFSVTLHEYTRMDMKYKLAGLIYLFFANEVIFTTEVERAAAIKIAPFRKNKFHVIRLYSNITRSTDWKSTDERLYDFIFFGLISAGKGIEDFIDAINKLDNKKIKTAIIGMVPDKWEGYLNAIKEKTNNIDFILNKDDETVSKLLNNSKYAYLPFKDGVSERNGSFLAVVLNGTLVITTKGRHTPEEFDAVCYYTTSENASSIMRNLINKKGNNKKVITQQDLENFAEKNIPQSWQTVSQEYVKILCK